MQKKPSSPSKIPVHSPHRSPAHSSPSKVSHKGHADNISNYDDDEDYEEEEIQKEKINVTTKKNTSSPRSPTYNHSQTSKKSVSQSPISDTKSYRTHVSILETVEERVDPNMKETKLKSRLNEILCEYPNSTKDAILSTLLYLEIGSNPLSGFHLNQISSKLLVLKLSHTKLEKASIPYIESLRTLFLDNCNLTSLDGFPQLPRLRFLSLANNKLETFKGFPVCPELEEFDITGNLVDFPAEIALEAAASVSLNFYNGSSITEIQINNAFSKSPLIGVALRQGLPIFGANLSAEEAVSIANEYLIRDLLKTIEPEGIRTTCLNFSEEAATITLPIKGKNIKWFINTQPTVKKPKEWESLKDTTDSIKKSICKRQILDVTQMMYQHLIRCEFSLPDDSKDRIYSLYTLNVIGVDDDLILPFPINPKVTGDPYEGSLVSLVPMPVPCHVAWFLEDTLISKGTNSIRLKDAYIDHEVSCLLQPHCRYMPKITFNRLLTKTDVVMRLSPIVTNLSFPDDIVEGTEFRFTRLVLPKREGNSEIAIERAISPSGNWEHVITLQPFHLVFTPSLDEVGYFLRIKYLPILNDGTRPMDNKPSFFYSKNRVIPGLPMFTDPLIAGEPRYGHSVVAIAKYFGGKKGTCNFKWYMSPRKLEYSHPFTKQKGAEEIKNVTTANIEISKNFVGLYLGVEMLPVRNDDTIGTSIRAVLSTPIEAGERLTPIRYVPDVITAYSNINVKMSVIWYRTNPDWRESTGVNTGFEKILAGPEYTPTDRDVGCFLRLMTRDGKSDMIVGEVQPSVPFIYNFSLNADSFKVGSAAEVPAEVFDDHLNDQLLRVPKGALKEYGYHRKVEIVWVRISKTGNSNNALDGKSIKSVGSTIEKVVDVDTTKYFFTNEDIGSKIKAVVYPLDDNGRRCKATHSEPTKTIQPFKFNTPILKTMGDLRVDELLQVEFDSPIYSITWQKTKKTIWQTICTYTFHHFDGDKTLYSLDTSDNNNKFYETPDYVLKKDDIDHLIQAEIIVGELKESFDQNGQKVPIMNPKFMHTPLRASTKTSTSSGRRDRVIPKDLHISVSKFVTAEPIVDGQTVSIKVSGSDATGKKPEIIWERLTHENNWEIREKGLSYTFTTDDIDFTFRIRCKNTNETIELGVIDPSLPSVKPFAIVQDKEGSVVIKTQYNGGFEGKSRFVYSFVGESDGATLEVKTLKKVVKVSEDVHKFTPTRDMFNRRIDVGYLPVRRDEKIGKCVWSTSGLIIKPIPVLDAYLDIPELIEVGQKITCVIKKCSMKANYKYTWRRFVPSTTNNNNNNKTNNAVNETFKKINVGEEKSYKLTKDDDNCYLVCQLVAIAENGFVSPIFVLDTYQIQLPEQKSYSLSIVIPSRILPDVKTTKKTAEILSKSNKAENEIDTGDVLRPILTPALKRGSDCTYVWQLKEINHDEADILIKWVTVSKMDEYQVSITDLNHLVRCICVIDGKEADEIESAPIGPVVFNPKIEAVAKAVIRSASFKIKGKAPTGNGQWDLTLSAKGLTVISRQGNENTASWNSVTCEPLREGIDQMELSTGPASRMIMIPEIVDKRMAARVPDDQVRDFCVYILNKLKKNYCSSISSPNKK